MIKNKEKFTRRVINIVNKKLKSNYEIGHPDGLPENVFAITNGEHHMWFKHDEFTESYRDVKDCAKLCIECALKDRRLKKNK